MKVKELIEKLKCFDQNAEAIVNGMDECGIEELNTIQCVKAIFIERSELF